MANQQKSLNFGTTEPGDDVLFIEFPLDMSSGSDGTGASAYCAFNNAFAATPTLLSLTGPDGVTPLAMSAELSPNGISIHGAAVSTGQAFAASVQVKAMVRGVLQ